MLHESKQAVLMLVSAKLREGVTALLTAQAMQSPGSRSTTSSLPNTACVS